MTLRIIGDIHGDYKAYKRIAGDSQFSVQLGDFGFHYSHPDLSDINVYNHRFFGGNHDNYDTYYKTPRALGDYGVACMGDVEFFYIRGEFSIDHQYRKVDEIATGRKSWWEEEQLSLDKMFRCLELYKDVKPKIVITHGCPRTIARMIGTPGILKTFGFVHEEFTTNTQELLESCMEYHQPEKWFFGHFHRNWSKTYAGIDFRCVGECQYVDIEDG